MKSIVHLLLCSVLLGCCDAAEKPWSRHVVDDSSRGADGVRLGDINGDGLFDIVTGWEEGGLTRVYLHPGHDKAKDNWPRVTVGTTKSVEDAVFADLDGDGTLDVVSCCEGSRRAVLVHWAPEKERLLEPEAWEQQELPASAGAMMWMFAVPIDVDGDGDEDLVAGGKGGGAAVGWFQRPADSRNLEDWIWHKIIDVGWVMSIATCDMDGDGDNDIVITDRKGPARGCKWIENPGSGGKLTGQWKSHPIGGIDREVMFMRQADMDADGLVDVLAATKAAEVLMMRRLDKTGLRWAETSVPYAPDMGSAKAVAVADIDLDGSLDMVISCESADKDKSGVKWMGCDGDPWKGGWTGREISGPDGIKFDRIELADVDGDGDTDVLTCEERYQGRGLGIIWYENPATRRSP